MGIVEGGGEMKAICPWMYCWDGAKHGLGGGANEPENGETGY